MKIDKKTRKAIEISIEKWKGIAEFGLREYTAEYRDYIEPYIKYICNCPLCDIYMDNMVDRGGYPEGRADCEGCPLNTKDIFCILDHSPYHKWYKSRTAKTASKYAQQLVNILEGFLK